MNNNWKELFGPYGIAFRILPDGSFDVKGKVQDPNLLEPALKQLAYALKNEISILRVLKKHHTIIKNQPKILPKELAGQKTNKKRQKEPRKSSQRKNSQRDSENGLKAS